MEFILKDIEPLAPDEIWATLDYYPSFKVSNYGRIVSTKRKKAKIIKTLLNRGYEQVVIKKDGIQRSFRVHQLVAIHFLQNPLGKATVNHINGIKTDNRAGNLEWMTFQENKAHALANGLFAHSSKSGLAKLSYEQVDKIRKERENGMSLNALANLFLVHPSTIQRIVKGINWKHYQPL